MGIGVSIFFLALGAVLAFAVHVEAEGFDINTVGVILMIVGATGLLLSMVFWSSWGGWGNRTHTTTEYHDHGTTHGHHA